MSRARKNGKRLTAEDILFGDWPTVDVSGDSGMGKSCLLVQLILAAMRTGVATLVIDPAGDLVDDIETLLSTYKGKLDDKPIPLKLEKAPKSELSFPGKVAWNGELIAIADSKRSLESRDDAPVHPLAALPAPSRRREPSRGRARLGPVFPRP